MTPLAAELLALTIYGPLVVLSHEAGHALFARLGGYRVTSFGVGLGAPLASLYLRDGVVFHLDRWLFAGGACTAIPMGPPTLRRMWFHGGGLLVQAIGAVLLLLLPQTWLIERVIQFNLLVALTNAIPWRVAGQASDGWYLLDAASGGRKAGSIVLQRPVFERMALRERAVGSPIGAVYSELCIAWADVVVGRLDQAAPLFQDEPPEATLDGWVDALYHYVAAEWHRKSGRPREAVRAAQAGTDVGRGSADGEGLLSLAEARALVDAGDPKRAERVLARAATSDGRLGAQASAVLLAVTLASEPELDDLEVAAWRVTRHLRSAWLDGCDAAELLHTAATRLEAAGRKPAAISARIASAQLALSVLSQVSATEKPELEDKLQPILQTRSDLSGAKTKR